MGSVEIIFLGRIVEHVRVYFIGRTIGIYIGSGKMIDDRCCAKERDISYQLVHQDIAGEVEQVGGNGNLILETLWQEYTAVGAVKNQTILVTFWMKN